MERKVAAKVLPLKNSFSYGPWTIKSVKGAIMKSDDGERLATQLDIPQLPEMLFGDNCVELLHEDGFGINFNATDALRRVNNKQDLMKVAVAEEWQRLRAETDGIKKVLKPFDWTFTTDYNGTLINSDSSKIMVSTSTERIDLEKLKKRENILFYEDLMLYEDELADNGLASLSIKIRVMPSSFFALLRFFLRVDNVLVRINDTRIYHEAGSDSITREYSSRQNSVSQLKNSFADPSELAQILPLISEVIEELRFVKENNPVQTPKLEDE